MLMSEGGRRVDRKAVEEVVDVRAILLGSKLCIMMMLSAHNFYCQATILF